MNVEEITARQYLLVGDGAAKNGADKLRLRKLSAELRALPMTRQRLAFEFLDLALNCVERGEEPAEFIGLAVALSAAINDSRLQEFSGRMETFVANYFKAFANQAPLGANPITFGMGLLAIARCSREKSLGLLDSFMKQCDGSDDPRRNVIATVKRILLKNGILDLE